MRPPLWGQLTDVPGVLVGAAGWAGAGRLTGVTVVVPPPGSIGSVDVRGGGPGTHETDALDPTTLVPTVDAVALTGGSAFGLAAAHGVQQWCVEQGRGFAAGPAHDPASILVPIVPAAAVFDLGRGGRIGPDCTPTPELGRAAADNAAADSAADPAARKQVPRGSSGAGCGALMAGHRLKGGVGTASVRLAGDLVVGAVVVVNALGSPVDPVTGALLGTAFIPPGRPRPRTPDAAEHAAAAHAALAQGSTYPSAVSNSSAGSSPAGGSATTLAVVATNAVLDPAQARRTATAAHDGIGRALSPAHTLFDGDTVFALSTGQIAVDLPTLVAVQAAAADAVLLAVLDAVLATVGHTGRYPGEVTVPAYLDHYPSASPPVGA